MLFDGSLGRAEAFASKNPLPVSAFDGLMMGLGFTFILVVLGGLRELLGNGTLLNGAERLFGAGAESMKGKVFKLQQQLGGSVDGNDTEELSDQVIRVEPSASIFNLMRTI